MADVPVLVTFDDPPVHETVLSVHFEPLSNFTSAHAGLLQSLHFPDFGQLRELPPYAMPLEQVDSSARTLRMALQSGLPPIRSVLAHESGEELYQVQRDWFAYNWKRRSEGSEYPRFSRSRDQFEAGWRKFSEFIEARPELSGPVVPLQAEVTYVNQLTIDNSQIDLNEYFPFLGDIRLGSTLGPLESIGFAVSAPMLIDGNAFGRLHVNLEPAEDESGIPIFALNLTARGRPADASIEAILDFLGHCRKAIVESFVGLTAEALHEKWNLK